MKVRKSFKFCYCFLFTPEEIFYLNYLFDNAPDSFHTSLEKALEEIMTSTISELKERYKP